MTAYPPTPPPVLLTGVAGFIGSKVAEFLLADGHTVVGVDNLNDAYDVRLKHWRLDQIRNHPHLRFHQLDICDRSALRSLFCCAANGVEGCQLTTANREPLAVNREPVTGNPPFSAVINLAARAGVRQSVANPWLYFETNVTGTLNLLELCHEFTVTKFVLASSSSLYGKDNPMPYREDADTDHPLSPYAASKKAAEVLCYAYHYLYGLDVTVLRYFTVYGPAGRPDMSLFRFVQWISEGRPVTVYGDGQQSRDFTYVEDIARGTIAALFNSQSSILDPQFSVLNSHSFEVINLGSDRPMVLMDAIRLVEEMVGKKAILEFQPRHPADVLATWANIGKAERLLGWRPRAGFDYGVKRLVSWYQANRDWAKDVSTC
jgi:nucleoside-diphosphate-sugar epimerase